MGIVSAFAVCHPPLILPFVGKGEEERIQRTIGSYREVARQIVADRPETVILVSPHATAYADYIHISPGHSARGSMSQFGAPHEKIDIVYDTGLVATLVDASAQEGIEAGTAGERVPELDHASFIPLWFIAQQLGITDGDLRGVFRVIRIGLSGFDALTHYRFGQCIARAVEQTGRRAVFIASGDLSHKLTEDGPYGFAPEGPPFDRKICEIFESGDFGQLLEMDPVFCDAASECGLRAFLMMAGALDGRDVEGGLLSYEGPFGVGYGMAAYRVGAANGARHFGEVYQQHLRADVADRTAQEDIVVHLARASLTAFIRTGTRLTLEQAQQQLGTLPPDLIERKAGAFVSLHEGGQLRGCIGTIMPAYGCIAEEILHNAVSACSEDPRFAPVHPDEIDRLEVSVDVLGAPEDVASLDDLDPRRYGVIVSHGGRRGLLLPDLEGVDTAEQQVEIARRKGGIGEHEPVLLQRFEVVRHT